MTRKIKITNTLYPDSVPNGTVMTITGWEPNGCVTAVKDGDSFTWFIDAGTFHVLDDTPIKLEVGKWYELKNGDVVECVKESRGLYAMGHWVYDFYGVWHGGTNSHNLSVKREVPAPIKIPTLWRDMTDAEKGALLLAKHEGRGLEYYSKIIDKWCKWNDHMFDDHGCGVFAPSFAYRVKPEHVRETVYIKWPSVKEADVDVYGSGMYKITFDTVDGTPDTSSIRMDPVS